MAIALLVAGAGVVAAAGTTGAAGAAPAQSPGVEVTVTPADGLVDGQEVDVRVSGLTGGFEVAQCDPRLLQRDATGAITQVWTTYCRSVIATGHGEPVDVAFTVDEAYVAYYRDTQWATRCGGAAEDCVIVVAQYDADRNGTFAVTPIHFGPPRPERAVVVEPSTGLRPGDALEVALPGFARYDYVDVAQCPAAALDGEAPAGEVMSLGECHQLSLDRDGEPVEPLTASGTVVAAGWSYGLPAWRCGPSPGGCVVVATGYSGGHVPPAVAWAPVTVVPDPLTVVPTDQEAGHPVHAFVVGEPGTTARLAVCGLPPGGDAAGPAGPCGPATPVTLDGAGEAAAEVTVLDRAGDGDDAVDCTTGGCGVTLSGPDGTAVWSVPLTVGASDGPPTVTLDGEPPFRSGEWVTATVTGVRNDLARVGVCDLALVTAPGGAVTDEACTGLQDVGGEHGTWSPGWTVRRTMSIAGRPLDCGTAGTCAVAAQSAFDGAPTGPVSTAPFTVAPPPELTITPDRDVVAGEAMTITANGLVPGVTYDVRRCAPAPDGAPDCDLGNWHDLAVAGPDGTLTVTAVADHRFRPQAGPSVTCRAQCSIGIGPRHDPVDPDTLVPFTMAMGTLEAEPAAGLADGDQVLVTGTRLGSTYGGGPWWIFETGEWAVGQCERAVLDDPTVAGVFRSCVAPPGGGTVDVPGHDLAATISVAATIDPPAGPPVACDAAPEACVAVLTRIEDDGTLTLLTRALSFAGGTA